MGNVTFKGDFTQAQRKIMLRAVRIGREDVMREAGEVMLDHISPYIPMKSGKLRHDGRVRVSPYRFDVTWGNKTPYAHYQFEGEVWGRNIITNRGWRRFPKTGPTGRKMGDGTSIIAQSACWGIDSDGQLFRAKKGDVIYTRHYTTPGTGDHWTDRFRQGSQYKSFRLWLTKHLQKVWERGDTK